VTTANLTPEKNK